MEQKMTNNHITIGILAHVDAGKTTLSEAMLYSTGQIRSLGREWIIRTRIWTTMRRSESVE